MTPKEGDLYKKITLHGKTFELRYGYYEDFERDGGEPIPIYPDFKKAPLFTDGGFPFVTAMQEPCEHYTGESGDPCCHECLFYKTGEELLGICTQEKNKLQSETYKQGEKQ